MDKLNSLSARIDAEATNSAEVKAVDPVCGMKVNPATAKFKTNYSNKDYFFCSAGCLAKFQANPEQILSAPTKPMSSGLVTLGNSAPAKSGDGHWEHAATQAARAYVCPMCPDVRQDRPGPCPKCGMALDPELPTLPAMRTEWTCPMHPEIVRTEPGHCPICGMALEPRTVNAGEEENPELRDMTRRFWVSVVVSVPLLAVAMGSMLVPRCTFF